jgi:hypothetical protein
METKLIQPFPIKHQPALPYDTEMKAFRLRDKEHTAIMDAYRFFPWLGIIISEAQFVGISLASYTKMLMTDTAISKTRDWADYPEYVNALAILHGLRS